MTEYTKPALPEPDIRLDECYYSPGLVIDYSDACVAAYKAHIRAEQGEPEDILATYSRTDGRREWVNVGCWLRPGEEIVHRAVLAAAQEKKA
jgi:hypothetical protein